MHQQPYSLRSFIDHHYCHFNAASLKDAATGYVKHLDQGGKMMVTLAGAMSTAELGKVLAEMIRQDKVHAICSTGANLEEDLFNLVAHDHYKRIPSYRELTPQDELDLLATKYNRVTDTCIPEEEAMRKIEHHLEHHWQKAMQENKAYLPHTYIYQLLDSRVLEASYQIDPRDSWLVAAYEKDLPLFVPGWEDSTLGNVFAARCWQQELQPSIILSGIHYMTVLATWYTSLSKKHPMGFFQIGGGIAGDFPICVVPMLSQDIKLDDVVLWQYFCQISDATTSYGSYSGAPPNEKITWGKLSPDTARFVIESDATIVAPLMFGYVLGW